MDKAELLRHWRFRVHRVQIGHYEAGRACENRHFWLGVPAVVISTVVGTAVFVSISEVAQETTLVWPKILVGLLSVTSGVLIGLQTFLRYREQAELHKVAGSKYAHLKHEIELLAAMPPDDQNIFRQKLIEIEKEWDTVRMESPNLPSSIWKKMEREITFGQDKAASPNFGEAA